MKLADVMQTLQTIAPLEWAEPWDNVGLLVGDPSQKVSRAMLAIDYTPAVASEAREKQCDLIVAYHPPIFEAVKRFTSDRATELVFDAARRGVAIYSPHTALDVAPGGTNDVLADAIAMTERRPLRVRALAGEFCKLVTFVPEAAIEKVSAAIFDAGAGHIGNYSHCSFRAAGTGTFKGSAGTNPTVGKPNVLESAPEIRLETIVPAGKVNSVIAALRAAHPYEEVAFDLLSMAALPTSVGIGRVGKLPGEVSVEMLAGLLQRSLNLSHVLIGGDRERVVRRVAVCAGAGGDLLKDAIAQKADLFVTGELRHHDVLRADRANMSVLCTLHSNSERGTLPVVAKRLVEAHANLVALVSETDRDPLVVG
jgi:dinuclear metal center YbgI/SA1388 family protein